MRVNKLVYLPDWSQDNPYQKLLYSELGAAGIPSQGLQGSDFTFRWIWANRIRVGYLHLHWLFGIYDPDRTGLDNKKAYLFIFKILFARLMGYKILWTVHNFVSHEPSHLKLEIFVRKTVALLANNVLTHCNYAKQQIRDNWKVAEDKIFAIPHGSYLGYYPNDITRETARAKLGIENDVFVFLFFGMVRNYKGVRPLIESFIEVKKHNSAVRLLIAGKPFDGQIKDYIETLALDEDIHLFLKFIPEDEVQYFFNASDAVVLPYQNILTSGAAILAVTFGRTVIVPRKGCIPELINDDIGFLYDHDKELPETMLRAVNDRIYPEESIKLLAQNLRWKNIIDSYYMPLIFSDVIRTSNSNNTVGTNTDCIEMEIKDHIKISAIICTHNRSDLLPKAIESLMRQSLTGEMYEIIVVDNASTDNTADVCKEFASAQNFRYIYEPVPGLSIARNRGMTEAYGRFVAFIDDDALASPTWLEKLVTAFETVIPSPSSVGGKINPTWEVPKPDWLPEQHISCLTILDYGSTAQFIKYPTVLYGTNMAFNRHELLSLSGFRTDIGRKKKCLLSCEESDVYRKFAAAGLRVYYEPDAYVHHLVPKERLDKNWIYKRQYWQGRSEVLLMPEIMEQMELKEEIRFSISEAISNLAFAIKSYNGLESDVFSGISRVFYNVGRVRQLLPKLRVATKTQNYTKSVDSYDFDNPQRFVPSGGIFVAPANGNIHAKENSVEITGVGGKDSWNFIQTEKVFLKPQTHYIISGWMRIDYLDEGSSFFKCEIFHKSKWLKNIDSNWYDISKIGEWQHLTAEFDSPEGYNTELNIAVEKRPFDSSLKVNMFIAGLCLQTGRIL